MKSLLIALLLSSYSMNAFAYEVLEEGSKTIHNEEENKNLDYVVLSVKGANIISCDNHLTEEICVWERYYFETQAYPFIKSKKKEGFYRLFVSKNEIPDINWWAEEITSEDLVDGILVLYKGLNSKTEREALATEIAFKFLYQL